MVVKVSQSTKLSLDEQMSDGIVNRDEKENVDDCIKYTVLLR